MNEVELDLVQKSLQNYDPSKIQQCDSAIQEVKQFSSYISSLHQAMNYIIYTRQVAQHEVELLNRVQDHFKQARQISDQLESPVIQGFMQDTFVSFCALTDLKPISSSTRESDDIAEPPPRTSGQSTPLSLTNMGSSFTSPGDSKQSGGFLRNYLRRNSRGPSSAKPISMDSNCAALDKELAKLENSPYAHSFNSSSTTIVALLKLLKPGEEVLVCDDIHEATYRQLCQAANRVGCLVRIFDVTCSIVDLVASSTRMVYIETPSRPMLRAGDIKNYSEILRPRNVLLVVDNSMMTCQYQKPMGQGADFVIYTETALLSGRSDLMCGLIFCKDKAYSEAISLFQSTEGAWLSPFDANIFRSGLKTLSSRLQTQHSTAERVAEYLSFHTAILAVHYPALRDNKFGKINKKQSKGSGIIISFQVGTADQAFRMIQSTKIFKTNSRFGSETSFISMPRQRWGAVGREQQLREPPEDLVCISIGSEPLADLIDDLQQALSRANEGIGPLRSPR